MASLYQSKCHFFQTLGSLCAFLRDYCQNPFAWGFPPVPDYALSFELSVFDIYRSIVVSASGTLYEGAYVSVTELVLLALGSDEILPVSFASQMDGWSGSTTGITTAYEGEEYGYFSDPAYNFAFLASIRKEMATEWMGAAVHHEAIYSTILGEGAAQDLLFVCVFDAISSQVPLVERYCVRDRLWGGLEGWATTEGIHPANIGTSLSVCLGVSALVPPLEDLASRGMTASFDDGRVAVDVTSGDVISEP